MLTTEDISVRIAEIDSEVEVIIDMSSLAREMLDLVVNKRNCNHTPKTYMTELLRGKDSDWVGDNRQIEKDIEKYLLDSFNKELSELPIQ